MFAALMVVAAVMVAACSGSGSIGASGGSAFLRGNFCGQVKYAKDESFLNSSSPASIADAKKQVQATMTLYRQLVDAAPAEIKPDMQTIQQVVDEAGNAVMSDNNLRDFANTVNTLGQLPAPATAAAVNKIDAYTQQHCGITFSTSPTTTSAPTTTTPAPATPTTTPPATTTPTTAAPATTAPAATASLPVLYIPPGAPGLPSGYSGRYPTTIAFSGDGGNVVGRISWSSWGPEQAVGLGIWSYLDCVPDCADGSDTPYPATLTLSEPAGGMYRKITEVTTGPHGFTFVVTYGSQSWLNMGVQ